MPAQAKPLAKPEDIYYLKLFKYSILKMNVEIRTINEIVRQYLDIEQFKKENQFLLSYDKFPFLSHVNFTVLLIVFSIVVPFE